MGWGFGGGGGVGCCSAPLPESVAFTIQALWDEVTEICEKTSPASLCPPAFSLIRSSGDLLCQRDGWQPFTSCDHEVSFSLGKSGNIRDDVTEETISPPPAAISLPGAAQGESRPPEPLPALGQDTAGLCFVLVWSQ